MTQQTPSSTWERSTTRRLLGWLFSRRALIALVWVISLIALCYGIIDWHGRHEWNQFRKSYEAKVASLDYSTYFPKPIPDDENFAATPFVQLWFKKGDTPFGAWNRARDMIFSQNRPPSERTFQDLGAWQEAFEAIRLHTQAPRGGFRTDKLDAVSRAQAAPALMDGLKDDDVYLDELRSASARPGAVYPVKYDLENPWGILLPHLARVKQTCALLDLKACAELALGHNDNAVEDVKQSFYMADTVKTEPFLISYLVRVACLHLNIQPIWEGLAEHRWTDAQLQQLQGMLEQGDYLADMQWPLHAECAMGALTVDLVRKKGPGLLAELGDTATRGGQKRILNALGLFIPSGWYDLEKLHYCQSYEAEFHNITDDSSRRVFPRQVAANRPHIRAGNWQAFIHHQFFSKVMLPALSRIPVRAAAAQVDADEADIACALERYRLANRQFPEDLESLAPRFIAHLPNDVITGEPYKYRRDGYSFVLYSVGWNEIDNGGVPGKNMFDEEAGDWVWSYPAK